MVGCSEGKIGDQISSLLMLNKKADSPTGLARLGKVDWVLPRHVSLRKKKTSGCGW